jgi:uncharacterized membrane protein YfcA
LAASLIIMIVVGVAAGFVNTLAGGGSLLSLPMLMVLGLPADIANGTNRVSVVVQSASSAVAFDRSGRLDRGGIVRIVTPTVLGALGGATVASYLPAALLKPLLVGALLVVAVLLLYRPEALVPTIAAGEAPRAPRAADVLGLVAIGFYGGFVQAGVGILLLAYLGGVLRYDLVRGNAIKAVAVTAFTAVALVVFLLRGQVDWKTGLVFSAGTALGALLGVRFALTAPQDTLRKILFVAVVLSCIGALMRNT